MDLHLYELYVMTIHVTTAVMPVCTASYMTADYGHAYHVF
jgi:hypothetical protein